MSALWIYHLRSAPLSLEISVAVPIFAVSQSGHSSSCGELSRPAKVSRNWSPRSSAHKLRARSFPCGSRYHTSDETHTAIQCYASHLYKGACKFSHGVLHLEVGSGFDSWRPMPAARGGWTKLPPAIVASSRTQYFSLDIEDSQSQRRPSRLVETSQFCYTCFEPLGNRFGRTQLSRICTPPFDLFQQCRHRDGQRTTAPRGAPHRKRKAVTEAYLILLSSWSRLDGPTRSPKRMLPVRARDQGRHARLAKRALPTTSK